MANGIRPIQDPFGLSRLADQIRANRQERAMSQTRSLQNELLSGRIEQQRMGLADLARERQNQEDLRGALAGAADQDPDRVALEFWQRRDPAKAAQARQVLFSQAGQLAKINPRSAVDFLNTKTGSNLEFMGQDDAGIVKIGSPASGKVILYDPPNDRIVRQFDFPVRGGEVIEVTPEGTKITKGGLQVEKFRQQQREKEAKKAERRQQTLGKINIVTDKVDEALAQTGLLTTGLLGTPLGLIPGTQARDFKGTIDTIKANLGFSTLQQMREASPTGGALGSVSERELSLLNSAVASLDPSQSPEAIRRNLEQVRTHFTNWRDSIVEARAQELKEQNPDLSDDQVLDALEQEGF